MMADQTPLESPPGNRRLIPLKYRFIFISSFLLVLLLGTLGIILINREVRSIQAQVERRGMIVAQSLAATSKNALATYNYIALQQTANQTQLGDPDLSYVIIHDKEGRVAGYSGRADLQGTFLNDEVSVSVLSATDPKAVRCVLPDGATPALDISTPVFIPGSNHRWGTVRVALSLEPMYQQIRQMQWIIVAIGCVALAVGIIVSLWAAGRITRPLKQLVHATIAAAQGNLTQEICVRTRDEVEILAANFATMIREILRQRQQLEHQLNEIRHLQLYTQKLLTTMNDGLLSVDTNGNIAAINPAACKLLGIPQNTRKGVSILSALEGIPEILSYVRDVVCDGGFGGPQELHTRSGEGERVILASSSDLTDAAGNRLEVIINLHDITELKRLEAKMRQSERLAALGTLAAGMAHEIRNPLSAIKTFVQLLPRKSAQSDFMDKFQRTVPRELNRINRLIEDLLELSRTPKYHFELLNVNELISQTVDFFDMEFREHGIQCLTNLKIDLPEVEADADQLTKAFHNLIRNAIQAMPQGGRLTIESSFSAMSLLRSDSGQNAQESCVQVSFTDTGNGITPEALKNIFNPFFTTKDAGTGLGLAITHKVITEHRGQIDVASEEGQGTCFRLFLPVARSRRDTHRR